MELNDRLWLIFDRVVAGVIVAIIYLYLQHLYRQQKRPHDGAFVV
jgi:hypothetical protein